ncbi:MAG: SAM-dependent methyltransferase [Alphaproteobacteria bacterium]|nr:SAM-dependent methyltransferase [Alphaproteobacteria bacterium]
MAGLGNVIRELIGKRGSISVADYMDLVLQHPEHGYYRHGDPLGQTGDFITAPEISQMFGEMIGLWCADVWRQMGKPEKFVLLELGPGRGTLMQDALRATAKITGFQQGMTLCLLESSGHLRKAQQEKLSDYKIHYIDDLASMPALPVLAIANEFFDALPIRQFEKTFQGWCERRVTLKDDELIFTLSPHDAALDMFIPQALREANPGTVHEASLASLAVLKTLSRHIAQHGGAALVIDYGYVEPPGAATLQAVAGHKTVDVLSSPGDVDVTAHVDFAVLKNVGLAQNVSILGPIGQGEFLRALGLELRAMQLRQTATPQQVDDINSALHRLTDSSQMGTLFKVMAVMSPQLSELPGF